MNVRLAVIVLNWNGLADTRECLNSLLAAPNRDARIYVVDNASSDGSVEALAREFGAQITLVVNSENLLYAGGNNAGIRRALDDDCSHLLLLNNDTIADARLLDELCVAADRSGDAILCPKIYFADPPDMLWYAGGVLDVSRATFLHRGHGESDHGQFDAEEHTDWATGCALFASRRVFEATGFLDERLGLYNEDVDFCLRAARSGFPIVYVPRGKVWHKVSASVGGFSLRKLRLKWISLMRLLRLHLPTRSARVRALAQFIVAELPKQLRHSMQVRQHRGSR